MNSIIKKTGSATGATVAIMGGIHGNERVGVEALDWAVKNLDIKAGTVYFIYANPEAIAQNVRLINKNLNRCFKPDNKDNEAEDIRAREIMAILDQCEALLDIHASNSRQAQPFIICEAEAFPIAQKLDFSIISSGWDALEGGAADGYMHRQNKPALCLECGSVFDLENNLPLAKKSIEQFLAYFGIIDTVPDSQTQQRTINVYKVGHKQTEQFSFARDFHDFEQLSPGEIFARDGEVEYRAAAGDCIIFPRPNGPIGSEAFILGRGSD